MSGDHIVALSGGVGGAKLVLGLSHAVAPEQLTVVTNTADDFDHFGLRVCPDTDTVLYTLGGLSNTELGWGRANETWTFMKTVAALGGAEWFNLGDGDLALHVLRTEALKSGQSQTEVTAAMARSMGIAAAILPMSDQFIQTRVNTPHGQLAFQEYFVRDRCEPQVTGFEFDGIDSAVINPLLLATLEGPVRAIIIAPSNPYVSVDPILAVPGMRAAIKASGVPVIAVSPIVAGTAIKGPAAKMMDELGVPSTVVGVAEHYRGFIDGLIIDQQDATAAADIESSGMPVWVTQTVMKSLDDRIDLANTALAFADQIAGRSQSL